MRVIGVDGCHSGWIAAGLGADGGCEVRIFPAIADVYAWLLREGTVLVDVPIGLRHSGPEHRRCDVEARKLLGGARASSVFTPPSRPALAAGSWEEACEINARLTGRRLSLQSWAIAPKIREVDRFLREDLRRQRHLRECHPELLFWALNGDRSIRSPKRRRHGRDERLAVLARHWPAVKEVFHRERPTLRRRGAAPDDLLDALAGVAAWLACDGRLGSIPAEPEHDEKGLRMEMVYPVMEKGR